MNAIDKFKLFEKACKLRKKKYIEYDLYLNNKKETSKKIHYREYKRLKNELKNLENLMEQNYE